jgi:hypothetical protein
MCEIANHIPLNNQYTLFKIEGQERKTGLVWGWVAVGGEGKQRG